MAFAAEKMAQVQEHILDEDYYYERYRAALQHKKLTQEGIRAQTYDEETVVGFANAFWWSLPDSPEIRNDIFFDLCEVAEHDYRESPE